MKFATLDASRPENGIDFSDLGNIKWEGGKKVIGITRDLIDPVIPYGEIFENEGEVVLVDRDSLRAYVQKKVDTALHSGVEHRLPANATAQQKLERREKKVQKNFVPTENDLLLRSIHGGHTIPVYSGAARHDVVTHSTLPFPEDRIKVLATGFTTHFGEKVFGHTLLRLNPYAAFQVTIDDSSLDSATNRVVFQWDGASYTATKYVGDQIYRRSSNDHALALDPEDDYVPPYVTEKNDRLLGRKGGYPQLLLGKTKK